MNTGLASEPSSYRTAALEDKLRPDVLRLAYHAALPVALNSELIHLLRINFFLDPPEALTFGDEVELIFSGLFTEIDDDLYEMKPGIRNDFIRRLSQTYGEARIREVAELLLHYSVKRFPWAGRMGLDRAQQLTALNFLSPDKVKEWVEEAEKSARISLPVERTWYVLIRQILGYPQEASASSAEETAIPARDDISEAVLTQSAPVTNTRFARALRTLRTSVRDFYDSYLKPQSPISELERAYAVMSQHYGLGYDDLEVSARIGLDGSAIIERLVTLTAYIRQEKLEQSLIIPERDPQGGLRERKDLEIQTWSGRSRASFVATRRSAEGQFVAEIVFTPPLSRHETATFKLTETLPAGIYAVDLAPEQLDRRESPEEYFGWGIDRPTRRFKVQVYFPVGYQPTGITCQVRYAPLVKVRGDSDSLRRLTPEEDHACKELRNIEDAGRHKLEMQVDYPLIGLIYIVSWKPLAR